MEGQSPGLGCEGSEATTIVIIILVTHIATDRILVKTDGGNGIATCPEMLARKVPFFALQTRHRNGALALQKTDHRRHRMLRWNRNQHVNMVRHQMAFENLALF